MRKLLLILTLTLICICNCAFAMTIKMLDVGSGESILIEHAGERILIDTGDPSDMEFPPINALILTHPHADHIGNAARLINAGVDAVYDNGQVKATRHYLNYLRACKDTETPHYRLKAGDRITIGDAYLECLSPDLYYRSINNNSLVLKLVYGEFTMLFTGDIEAEAEEYLYQNAAVRAKVLKAAHHGSRTSSTLDFVKAVNPEVVLISAGDKYGHPHKITLENYIIAGAEIYCTKYNDAITITTDGQSYSVGCNSVNWLNEYLGYRLKIRKI